jgi:hypothetical protein
MNEITRKNLLSKLIDILVIIILVFLPGIRGYSNWSAYEYMFIFIPIAAIIYHWIKGK